MDLARRGIDVSVLECRAESEPADAKCSTVAARTMEVFRQLGVADAVRAGGLRRFENHGDGYTFALLQGVENVDVFEKAAADAGLSMRSSIAKRLPFSSKHRRNSS